MQESDGLLRREKMTEEEWEQETYKAVVTAITALERVISAVWLLFPTCITP